MTTPIVFNSPNLLSGHAGFPRSWFTNEESYPALFSTLNGKRPKRAIDIHAPSPPIARSDPHGDAFKKADALRKQFPDLIMSVKSPDGWQDLKHWFDAEDIWMEGATFLRFVLIDIHTQNELLVRQQQQEEYAKQEKDKQALRERAETAKTTLNHWASTWVVDHEHIAATAPIVQPLTDFFTKDEMDRYWGLTPQERTLLDQLLLGERQIVKAKWTDQGRLQHLPPKQIPQVSAPSNLGCLPSAVFMSPPKLNQYHTPQHPQPVYHHTPQHFGYQSDAGVSQQFPGVGSQIPIARTQGNVPGSNGDLRWTGRSRGYSYRDSSGEGQQPPRAWSRNDHHADYAQHNRQFNQRRVSNISRPGPGPIQQQFSLERRTTQEPLTPVYVLKSRADVVSPILAQQSCEVDTQKPYHVISSSSTPPGRGFSNDARVYNPVISSSSTPPNRGFPNDARLYNSTPNRSGYNQNDQQKIEASTPSSGIFEEVVDEPLGSTTYYMPQETISCSRDNGRTLWLGNIESTTGTRFLRNLFSRIATVEYIRRLDHKRYAFVQFTEEYAIQQVMSRLNEFPLPDGNYLKLGYAKSSDGSSRSRGYSRTSQNSYPTSISRNLNENNQFYSRSEHSRKSSLSQSTSHGQQPRTAQTASASSKQKENIPLKQVSKLNSVAPSPKKERSNKSRGDGQTKVQAADHSKPSISSNSSTDQTRDAIDGKQKFTKNKTLKKGKGKSGGKVQGEPTNMSISSEPTELTEPAPTVEQPTPNGPPHLAIVAERPASNEPPKLTNVDERPASTEPSKPGNVVERPTSNDYLKPAPITEQPTQQIAQKQQAIFHQQVQQEQDIIRIKPASKTAQQLAMYQYQQQGNLMNLPQVSQQMTRQPNMLPQAQKGSPKLVAVVKKPTSKESPKCPTVIEQPQSSQSVFEDLDFPPLGPSKPLLKTNILWHKGERPCPSPRRKESDPPSETIDSSRTWRLTVGGSTSTGSQDWPYVKQCTRK